VLMKTCLDSIDRAPLPLYNLHDSSTTFLLLKPTSKNSQETKKAVMTAYYPSQGGYASSQPVGMPMAQPYGVASSYGVPAGGVMYVPSYPSYHSRRRHRHSYPSYAYDSGLYSGYGGPNVVSGVPTVGAPVIMQPSYAGAYGYNQYSFGNRLRRFFGMAPNANVRYKHDRSTWGFMGYSRRQRYIDARTGGEVDRQGRPVYRI